MLLFFRLVQQPSHLSREEDRGSAHVRHEHDCERGVKAEGATPESAATALVQTQIRARAAS